MRRQGKQGCGRRGSGRKRFPPANPASTCRAPGTDWLGGQKPAALSPTHFPPPSSRRITPISQPCGHARRKSEAVRGQEWGVPGGERAIRQRAPNATVLGGVGALPAHSSTTTIWSSHSPTLAVIDPPPLFYFLLRRSRCSNQHARPPAKHEHEHTPHPPATSRDPRTALSNIRAVATTRANAPCGRTALPASHSRPPTRPPSLHKKTATARPTTQPTPRRAC